MRRRLFYGHTLRDLNKWQLCNAIYSSPKVHDELITKEVENEMITFLVIFVWKISFLDGKLEIGGVGVRWITFVQL